MATKKVRKVRITKGEKMLYFMATLAFAFTIVIKIFGGAGVGHLDMSVSKVKYDISAQEKKNESLTMKVNELTSFDKVKEVVKDMGLAYNYDNVVMIDN